MFHPVALIGNLWTAVLFSRQRAQCCTDTQEEMRYEGSPVKAPPLSRRRMTPPTPLQNSYTSFVRDHGRIRSGMAEDGFREKEQSSRGHNSFWKEATVWKVTVDALEDLLGPEDVDVDFRRILKEARDERGRKIFEIFISNDMSFLVAEWSRWDKYKRAPWRNS